MKILNKSFLAALLVLIAPIAGRADAVQALQSDSFVDSIGVATHLNYSPSSTNWSTLEPLLTGLGVRHIRDGVFGPTSNAEQYNPEVVDLSANHGIKSTLVLDERTAQDIVDPTQIEANLTYLQDTTFSQYNNDSLLSAVEAIEGPNEFDINCPSGDQNWVGELTGYCQSLYTDVHGNSAFAGVSVLAPAMGQPTNQISLPDMAAYVDLGNDHPYPGTGNPGYCNLDTYLTDSTSTWPSLPLEISEDGYSTMSGDPSQCVTEAVQAILEPRLLLENFRRGVKRTFLYDFVDEDATGSTSNYSHHFGLVHNDGTFSVKPAYTVIKNLISILSDAGTSFTPGALSFNLSGTTADVHTLLLGRRDGQYELVLWVESSNTSASQAVTVTFDDAMGTSETYNPAVNTTATPVTLTNNAITLTVTSSPIILRTYPSIPNGSLIVDELANLSLTSSNLNWTTLAATPTNWLGRTTEAERTAANGNDYLTYASVDIRGFTALLGMGWNSASPDGVTYNFSKIVCSASPDGSTWTSVLIYVGEIDKSATLLAQASARWLIPVSPSAALPAGTNYIKFSVNSTDGVTLPQLFQMNVRQSGAIEAESMAQTVSGATSTTVANGGASNGEYVQFNATGTGQYIQFTTPTLPPGKYSFWYRYMRGTSYGVCQPSIDGTNIGGATGQNGTAGQFVETNRGTVTFTSAATHTIRFTVTGTATTGYTVDCDRVVFQQE